MLKHCPERDCIKRWLLLGWTYGIVLAYLYFIWIEKVSKELPGIL